MISEARHEVAVTSAMAPPGGSCKLLHWFVGGTLRGDDYLQLLFHLDHCARCFDRVRAFPQEKRRQLYALISGLEEGVLEEPEADQEADRDEEEAPMLIRENRPLQTEAREELDPVNASVNFTHVARLLEQEIRDTDDEIERLKAQLSAMEDRGIKLRVDWEHLQAASQILERYKGAGPPKVVTSVPFVPSRTDYAGVTQREAIIQTLSQNPPQALNKKLLTQELIDGGFPFRSVERAERQNAVYQTCRRMVERHELVMTIHGRDSFYQLANSSGSGADHRNVASGSG